MVRKKLVFKLFEELNFKPSTTIEEGNLLITDIDKHYEDVMLKQLADWNRIVKLLRKHKLTKSEKGLLWFICDSNYNWRGWADFEGLLWKIGNH